MGDKIRMGLFKIDTKGLKGTTLSIIDANALAATKYYSFKDFSWVVNGDVVMTGAIYAVIGILKEVNLNEGNRVIFCFDSRNNQRKEENTDYKAGRIGLGNAYYIQLDKAKAILTMCGFEVYAKEGYEADDFVVGGVKNFEGNYDNVIVYTNDDDMAQVIDDKVMIRSINSKRNDITIDNYEEVIRVPYNTVLLQKAIVGCKSDNVKGIPGYGDAKFRKLLNNVIGKYNLKDVRKNEQEEEILRDMLADDTEEHLQMALDSLKLVKVRLPAEFNFIDEKQYINYTTLANQCDKYGMKSITKHLIEQGVIHSII